MKPCPACATENPIPSQRCSVCGGSLEPTLAATVVATTRKTTREPAPTSDSDSSVHGRFLPGTKIAEQYRIGAPINTLFGLMILFLFRLVLRREFLASCAYVAVWTVVLTLLTEAHPVLGWFVVAN